MMPSMIRRGAVLTVEAVAGEVLVARDTNGQVHRQHVGPARAAHVTRAAVAAPRLGLRLQAFEVRSDREIVRVFAVMTRERVGAVLVYGSSMLAVRRATIGELAPKSRLPTMAVAREWMDAGFIMSYGTNLNDMYRRAPYFVDKILRGAKPAGRTGWTR